MKKFIKKTLAGLIAGVMAVSSMPFAALTVQAADSTEKAYVKANIESFTGYTGTAKYTYNGTDLSSSDSAYNSNVLYDDGTFNDSTSQVDNSNFHAKVYINNNVVLMYDGKKDTILPVVIRPWTTSKTFAAAVYFVGSEITDSTTSASWELKENWLGGSQTYNEWPTGTSSYGSSSISNSGGLSLSAGTNYIFKNKLYYKGATSSAYSEKFNNSIKLRVRSYYSSFGTHDLNIDVANSTSNVYVVNYKPIADKIDAMKAAYQAIQTNGEDKYCADYLENFYQAAYKVMTLNPNTYSYSSGVETAVQNVANDIKNVVDNYLTTASTEPTKHTEETVAGTPATCTSTGLTDGKKCSHCGVTLVEQTKIPVDPEAHQADTAVKENYKEATCTTAGTYDVVIRCKLCGAEMSRLTNITDTDAPATGHKYVYEKTDSADTHNVTCEKGDYTGTEAHDFDENGLCTKCGYQKVMIDYSAFDAAVKKAEELDNSDGVYSDESFAAYQAKVAEIKAKRDTVSSQDELDALVKELATASDLLVKTTFTVKFVKVENGNESTVEEMTFKYGESYAPASDKNVEKWVVTTDNGNTTTKLNTYETSVTIIITKDAVVYAYQTDEAQTATSSKVTFYGKNNQVVAVKYVEEGNTLDLTSDEMKKLAPSIPFYDFNGWDVASVTGDGNDYSVKAVYECTQAEDEMCGVHYAGFENGVKKYSYDSYVYLTGADKSKKYALYSDEACTQLLTVLDGIDFYAPKRANIYVKEVTGEVAASIGITGSFSQRTSTTKSAVYNCKFYLPEGATAVEWGLEVTINGKTAKVKGETKSERNEYSIRLNAPLSSSIDSVDGRAYVTYTLNGETTTIYSKTSVNQTL